MTVSTQILAHVTTGILTLAGTIYIGSHIDGADPSPRLVLVDGQASVLQFIDAVSKDMGEEEYKARIAGFAGDMDLALQSLAKDHNLIILNAKAVLAGGQEITGTVVEQVLAQ